MVETTAMSEARRLGRWAEFAGLYVAVPVAIAVFLPASTMFPVLFAFTALGLVLLHLTPGFAWADLTRGWNRIDWRFVAGFAAVTGAVCLGVLWLTAPERLFVLVRRQPGLLAMIVVLYPVLSALPQELVFRPLFFRRYGAVLPKGRTALVLNAAVFSFAHLMYWSWIVAAMTFSGGLVFAWAYEARRNFAMAVVLHALAGVIVFAAGLGMFFYSGNVTRPF